MPVVNETQKAEEVVAPVRTVAPPGMSWAWRWTNYLFFLPAVGLATVLFGTISLVSGLWDKEGRQQHAIARQWARLLLRVAMSPVTVEHAERLPVGEAAVYA